MAVSAGRFAETPANNNTVLPPIIFTILRKKKQWHKERITWTNADSKVHCVKDSTVYEKSHQLTMKLVLDIQVDLTKAVTKCAGHPENIKIEMRNCIWHKEACIVTIFSLQRIIVLTYFPQSSHLLL